METTTDVLNLVEIENILPSSVSLSEVLANQCNDKNSALSHMLQDSVNTLMKEKLRRRLTVTTFESPYDLADDQVRTLSRMYPEFNLTIKPGAARHSHAVAATSRIIEKLLHCRNLGVNNNTKKPDEYDYFLTDCGGNYTAWMNYTPGLVHCCEPPITYYDVGRYAKRQFDSLYVKPPTTINGNINMNSVSNGGTIRCRSLFQKCNVTSVGVVAIHSIYDINVNDFCLGMYKKKAQRASISFLFDPNIMTANSGRLNAVNCSWKLITYRGERCIEFFFDGDYSATYRHNLKTYLGWLMTNTISIHDTIYILEINGNREGVLFMTITATKERPMTSTMASRNLWSITSEPMTTIKHYNWNYNVSSNSHIDVLLKPFFFTVPTWLFQMTMSNAQTLEDSKFLPKNVHNYALTYNTKSIMDSRNINYMSVIPPDKLLWMSSAIYLMLFRVKWEQGKIMQALLAKERQRRAEQDDSVFTKLIRMLQDKLTKGADSTLDKLYTFLVTEKPDAAGYLPVSQAYTIEELVDVQCDGILNHLDDNDGDRTTSDTLFERAIKGEFKRPVSLIFKRGDEGDIEITSDNKGLEGLGDVKRLLTRDIFLTGVGASDVYMGIITEGKYTRSLMSADLLTIEAYMSTVVRRTLAQSVTDPVRLIASRSAFKNLRSEVKDLFLRRPVMDYPDRIEFIVTAVLAYVLRIGIKLVYCDKVFLFGSEKRDKTDLVFMLLDTAGEVYFSELMQVSERSGVYNPTTDDKKPDTVGEAVEFSVDSVNTTKINWDYMLINMGLLDGRKSGYRTKKYALCTTTAPKGFTRLMTPSDFDPLSHSFIYLDSEAIKRLFLSSEVSLIGVNILMLITELKKSLDHIPYKIKVYGYLQFAVIRVSLTMVTDDKVDPSGIPDYVYYHPQTVYDSEQISPNVRLMLPMLNSHTSQNVRVEIRTTIADIHNSGTVCDILYADEGTIPTSISEKLIQKFGVLGKKLPRVTRDISSWVDEQHHKPTGISIYIPVLTYNKKSTIVTLRTIMTKVVDAGMSSCIIFIPSTEQVKIMCRSLRTLGKVTSVPAITIPSGDWALPRDIISYELRTGPYHHVHYDLTDLTDMIHCCLTRYEGVNTYRPTIVKTVDSVHMQNEGKNYARALNLRSVASSVQVVVTDMPVEYVTENILPYLRLGSSLILHARTMVDDIVLKVIPYFDTVDVIFSSSGSVLHMRSYFKFMRSCKYTTHTSLTIAAVVDECNDNHKDNDNQKDVHVKTSDDETIPDNATTAVLMEDLSRNEGCGYVRNVDEMTGDASYVPTIKTCNHRENTRPMYHKNLLVSKKLGITDALARVVEIVRDNRSRNLEEEHWEFLTEVNEEMSIFPPGELTKAMNAKSTVCLRKHLMREDLPILDSQSGFEIEHSLQTPERLPLDKMSRDQLPPVSKEDSLQVYLDNRKFAGSKYNPQFEPYDSSNKGVIFRNAMVEAVTMWETSEEIMLPLHQKMYKEHTPIYGENFNRVRVHLQRENIGFISTLTGEYVLVPKHGVTTHAFAFDGEKFVRLPRTRDGQLLDLVDLRSSMGDRTYLMVSDMTELMVESALALSVKNIRWITLRPDLSIKLVLGVPGCGKTSLILKHVKNGDSIIAATREGANSIARKVPTDLRIPKVRTVHSYIINKVPGRCDTLYVDEVMMRHVGEVLIAIYISGCKNVVMVGDKKQIPFFTILTEVFMLYSEATLTIPTVAELLISHRCPLDVMAAISRFYEGDVKTTSKVARSLEIQRYTTFDLASLLVLHSGAKVMCYKQSEKLDPQMSSFNPNTIGEFQGQEVQTVILVRLSSRDNDEIYNREDQTIVGITRHRQKFIYYTPRIEDLMTKIIALVSNDTDLGRFASEKGNELPMESKANDSAYMSVPGDGKCLYRSCFIACGAIPWSEGDLDSIVNIDLIRYALYMYVSYNEVESVRSLYDFSSLAFDEVTLDPHSWANIDMATLLCSMMGRDLTVVQKTNYVTGNQHGKPCIIRLVGVEKDTAHAEPLPAPYTEEPMIKFVTNITNAFKNPEIKSIIDDQQSVKDGTAYTTQPYAGYNVYVTRATLKLLEMLAILKNRPNSHTNYICDLGSAPGGWESLLSTILPQATVHSYSTYDGQKYQVEANPNVVRRCIISGLHELGDLPEYEYIFCDAASETSWISNAEACTCAEWSLQHLRAAGTLLIKIANVFKNEGIRAILSGKFANYTWVKPLASRSHNTEVYLICEGYKSNNNTEIPRPDNIMCSVLTTLGTISKQFYDGRERKNRVRNVPKSQRSYRTFMDALAGSELRKYFIGGFASNYTQYLTHSRKFDIPEVVNVPYLTTVAVPIEVGSYEELSETCELLITASRGSHTGSEKIYRCSDFNFVINAEPENRMRCMNGGGWSTLQNYYDVIMPLCGTYSREKDQMLAELCPLNYNFPNVIYNVGYVPSKDDIPTLRSLLRTSMPHARYPSPKDTICALKSRNINVPELSGIVDEDVLVVRIVQKFIDVMMIEESTVFLERWRERTVKPNPVDLAEWLTTQPTDLLKQITNPRAIQNRNLTAYTLMNKRQVKPDLSINAPFIYGNPQTICYTEKELNAIFCHMFRVMKNRFMKLLREKYIMYTDMSPEDFANMLTMKFPYVNIGPGSRKLEVDMAKYDKSQQRLHLKLELELYRRLGMDENFRKLWYKGHAFTSLTDYNNKVKAFVAYQRKSGDASTYFGNTAVLMMMLNWAYDLKSVDLALFSGDDSVLIGGKIGTDLASEFAILFNMETKFFRYDYVYFCSKFLLKVGTRYYFVPDLIKLITKLGRADMRNYDHVEEYRKSLKDLTNVFNDDRLDSSLSFAIQERYGEYLPVFYVLSSLLELVNDPEMFASGYVLHQDEDILHTDPSLPSLD